MAYDRPLVLTLRMDDAAQARLDRERAAYFPPGRTSVGAHLTLFHALPGALRDRVEADLEEASGRPAFELSVTEPYSLGRGVAYRLESPELQGLRADLQGRWTGHLTRQDRQRHRPHVTVQNKVTPEQARATLEELRSRFLPFTVSALGMDVWRYDGGPWTLLRSFDFERPQPC
jgi:2'-5' RNA ligase